MEKKKEGLMNIAYLLLGVGLIFVLIKYVVPVLLPFIVAFIIAAVLRIPITKMHEKFHINRKVIAILTTAAFYVIMLVLILFAGSRLILWAGDMIPKLPALYNDRIYPWMEAWIKKQESGSTGIMESVMPYIMDAIENVSTNIGTMISEYSGKAISFLSGFATAIPGIVVKLVITVVATFFIVIDFETIRNAIKRVMPKKVNDMANRIFSQTGSVLKVYVKSYSFLMALTFAELTIGLLILRIPHPFLIALAIAVFDILPVLGTGGILLPWAVIAFLMKNYFTGIGILIMYLVITIVRNTLEPRIVGGQIGLHPLVTLIALFVGGNLFGIVGLIGLPVGLSIGWSLYKAKDLQVE